MTFEAVGQIKRKLFEHPDSRKVESSEYFLIWPTASKVTGGGGGDPHTTSFYSAKVCIYWKGMENL